MADNVTYWPGKSGTKYAYWSYPIGSALRAAPGNYIFAKVNAQGYWEPVYIGETEDLDTRVATHEKRDCADRNGATHIHAHLTSGGRQARLDEETDLRKNFSTACNIQ